MRLVMLGFPGAGKGTQAQFLAEYLAVLSLSSGDLFRRHQREGTPLGEKVREYVDKGLLVPDNTGFEWLDLVEPDAVVGKSIRLYNLERRSRDQLPDTSATGLR